MDFFGVMWLSEVTASSRQTVQKFMRRRDLNVANLQLLFKVLNKSRDVLTIALLHFSATQRFCPRKRPLNHSRTTNIHP